LLFGWSIAFSSCNNVDEMLDVFYSMIFQLITVNRGGFAQGGVAKAFGLFDLLRNPQKIEWRLHLDLPFHPSEIQKFAQKEVRKLL
jgi:hypothetical protein